MDGPGIRTVLYVQGCHRKCHGCHNPNTWSSQEGTKIEVKNLANEIRSKSLNNKLTISGGEPLLQYNAVLELVKDLNTFDKILYTGFELEEVPKEMLSYLKYIKVGKFINEEVCTTLPYIGSKNQQFIDLRGSKYERVIS